MPIDVKKYYSEPLYRNSIAIMLNLASGAFFGLIFWIVAARTMPPQDVGLATAAISISLLIISLSKLGMDVGIIRFLPTSKNKVELYNTVMLVTLMASIVMAVLFIVAIDVLSPALAYLKQSAIAIIFIGYVATASVSGMQNNVLIAMRKGGLALLQNLLLALRIPALLLVTSLGALGVISAIQAAYLITLIFGVYVLYRLGLPVRISTDFKEIKEIIMYSLGNYAAGILLIVPATVLPVIIVNVIGAKEGAYFYVAYSISSLLFIIPGAIAMSLFVEGSHDSPMRENTLKSIKFTIMLLVPGILFVFLFGDRVLMLFSQEYSEQSFYILKILALSSIFSAITAIYVTMEKVKKRLKTINLINLLNATLTIGLGYVFADYYGLAGIGYSWMLASIIVCIIVVAIMLKEGL